MNNKFQQNTFYERLLYMQEMHWFFWRKSQHYLNGNWKEYVPFTISQKLYEPMAYIKFMVFCWRDSQWRKPQDRTNNIYK